MKQLLFFMTTVIALQGCQITKPLTLEPIDYKSSNCEIPASTLEITPPMKGSNVFKFEDIINGRVITPNSITIFNNYKRADFIYQLTEDSSVTVKRSLDDLFPNTGSKPVYIDLNFNYYITNTNAMSNDIALVITSIINSEGLSELSTTVKIDNSYSTFPVTYPNQEVLNKMFAEGLQKLKNEICHQSATS